MPVEIARRGEISKKSRKQRVDGDVAHHLRDCIQFPTHRQDPAQCICDTNYKPIETATRLLTSTKCSFMVPSAHRGLLCCSTKSKKKEKMHKNVSLS